MEEEKNQYVKNPSIIKTEEVCRIQKIIKEFKENLLEYQGSLAMESYISYFYDYTVSFFDYFDIEDTSSYLMSREGLLKRMLLRQSSGKYDWPYWRKAIFFQDKWMLYMV